MHLSCKFEFVQIDYTKLKLVTTKRLREMPVSLGHLTFLQKIYNVEICILKQKYVGTILPCWSRKYTFTCPTVSSLKWFFISNVISDAFCDVINVSRNLRMPDFIKVFWKKIGDPPLSHKCICRNDFKYTIFFTFQ